MRAMTPATNAPRSADRSAQALPAAATPAVHVPRLSADEARAGVIESAVRAFASGGLHGTSTEEIARLAGVSQPYLFRLFGTKRDLFLAAVERAFARIEAAFEDAAEHPMADLDTDYDPVLAAIGHRYG